jgi:DNA-binding beta-propeller fold protein YncE
MAGSSDGSGAAARFDMPHALAFDGAGNLLVADTRNHTVRKVAIAGGAVTTYVGNPAIGAVQLGALPGALNTPTGIALGPNGELYVATAHENAILVVK